MNDELSLRGSDNFTSTGSAEPFRSSTLSVLARRAGAGFADAIIFAVVSAAAVAAQMTTCLGFDVSQIMTIGIASAFAFAVAFLDVISGTGVIALIAAGIYLTWYGEEATKWIQLLFIGLVLPLNFLYHVAFECSSTAATPGKRLFGLKVRTTAGDKPSFLAVAKRHLSKTVSIFALIYPVLHLFTARRYQLLHDRVAGSVVAPLRESIPNCDSEVAATISVADSKIMCASLWRRIPAALLDSITFGALYSIVFYAVFLVWVYTAPAADNQIQAFVMYGVVSSTSILIAVLGAVLVMAVCESSRLRATPGKVVLGLIVARSDLGQVRFKDALIKQLMQGIVYLSTFPMVAIVVAVLSYICYARNEPNNIGFCFLTGYILLYVLYGIAVCATFFKDRRTFLDLLCQRYVFLAGAQRNRERIR